MDWLGIPLWGWGAMISIIAIGIGAAMPDKSRPPK